MTGTTKASGATAVRRVGDGPEVILVHGGASPTATWTGIEPLTKRWTLVIVHRRGFPPSPPAPAGCQDFVVDADDVAPLLDSRPHVVAHSYGGLGALLAQRAAGAGSARAVAAGGFSSHSRSRS